MNNAQFRRLLLDTPTARPNASKDGSTPARKDGLGTTTLGSKMRSSIPMTPRSVTGVDFARQLAEHNARGQEQPAKRFRSSAAPKGVKLPSGYRDRTQEREGYATEDEKAARIQALEEMVKLGQMEQAEFEQVRDEIVGGDIKTTHLVKGLDRRLLERVRRGEDVLRERPTDGGQEELAGGADAEAALDEEFDSIEAREVVPIVREESPKNDDMAPPPRPMAPPASVAGKKRSRDEILAELKASRKGGGAIANAIKAPPQPTLGPKFRKVGEKREQTRIERDERGREVLITVDENGRVKRKVRNGKASQAAGGVGRRSNDLPMPDKDVAPLGMEVPEELKAMQEQEDEETGDIFDEAGSDYDLLAGLDDDDEDDEEEEEEDREVEEGLIKESDPGSASSKTTRSDPISPDAQAASRQETTVATASSTTTGPSAETVKARNYFSTSSTDPSGSKESPSNPLSDPTILAALRKASTLDPSKLTTITGRTNRDIHQDNDDEWNEQETLLRRRQRHEEMLSSHDRDAADLDLGFGSSRVEDEEGDDGKVKLSAWGGGGGGGGGDEDGGRGRERGAAAKKRKRGPKKKKGDVNNAADVLRVVAEQRKMKTGS